MVSVESADDGGHVVVECVAPFVVVERVGVVVNPGGGVIGVVVGTVCVDVVLVVGVCLAEARLLVRMPLSASPPLSSQGTD